MKNQAVVDIEDYYSMRKKVEDNETLIRELKKKEGELLEQMKMLKFGIITVITTGGIAAIEPPYQVDHKDDKLIIKIRPNTQVTDKFKDVIILR